MPAARTAVRAPWYFQWASPSRSGATSQSPTVTVSPWVGASSSCGVGHRLAPCAASRRAWRFPRSDRYSGASARLWSSQGSLDLVVELVDVVRIVGELVALGAQHALARLTGCALRPCPKNWLNASLGQLGRRLAADERPQTAAIQPVCARQPRSPPGPWGRRRWWKRTARQTAPAGIPAGQHDQRDGGRLLVHERALIEQLVGAHDVAVIREVDHDRVVRLPRLFQHVQRFAEARRRSA